MKWGKRKINPPSLNKSLAKSNRRAANKARLDAESIRSQKKQMLALTKNGKPLFTEKDINNMIKTYDSQAKKSEEKARSYDAKAERKEAIKAQTKEINKQTSFGEKMLYSNSVRKRAAKYMVDHNMSMEEARRASNDKALKTTVAYLAGYGATMVVLSKIQ